MHENSLRIFRHCIRPQIRPSTKVLEISPEAIPGAYQREANGFACWHYLTLGACDGAAYEATSEYSYPVESGSYDMVLSGQVIEHVRMPWLWVRELARIVKPGGLVVTIAPVSWPYHEVPIDCWRIYADGMAALYEYAGLTVELSQSVSLDQVVTDTVAFGRLPLQGSR